jgi:hypothetical protein
VKVHISDGEWRGLAVEVWEYRGEEARHAVNAGHPAVKCEGAAVDGGLGAVRSWPNARSAYALTFQA